ncbi:hypothetical protein ABRZ24_21650, partial [Brenneria populi]|nr:hypothetical protein [Brenneria populi Li et al. 2015]
PAATFFPNAIYIHTLHTSGCGGAGFITRSILEARSVGASASAVQKRFSVFVLQREVFLG